MSKWSVHKTWGRWIAYAPGCDDYLDVDDCPHPTREFGTHASALRYALANTERPAAPQTSRAGFEPMPPVEYVPAAMVEHAGDQRIGFEIPRTFPRWWD